MHTLRLACVGPAVITRGEQPISDALPPKALALLCYLAISGQPHSRAALAGLLWGEVSEDDARGSLRQALARLRPLVGDYLRITRETLAFDRTAPYWLDVEELERATSSASTTFADQELRNAVTLIRGELLHGLFVRGAPDWDDWLTGQRERIHQLALHALHQVATHALHQGTYAEGIDAATRLLALEPWQEDGHRLLMRLLALAGRAEAALAHYDHCRELLERELGAEPALETTILADRIRSGALRVPPRADRPRHNLPTQRLPLIGRADDVAAVTALLARDDVGVVTLVGPGGVGKTRLALEVAHAALASFGDGVWLVDLAPISDAELVLPTIMKVLGIEPSAQEAALSSLAAALRDTTMLLLLDNLEQLLAAAPLLSALLAAAPKLKLLATSRQQLHLRSEHVFPVLPLAVPDAHARVEPAQLGAYAAVALFVERATQQQPSFALSAENAAAVAQICRRLDGLPLAIELAAARVRLFPPVALVQRLSNRLDLLTRGPNDVPARQQTLQNTLDWSYNLLERGEQTLFAHLAVFVGGWTVAAAEGVCGESADVFDALQGLLDKHLIYQVPRLDGEPRFTMLETIREYAQAQLAQQVDATLIRQRHAAYHLALVEVALPVSQERPDSAHLAAMKAEYHNQRAALQWLVEQRDSEGSLRLCNGLTPLWDLHGPVSEGRRWLDAALALASAGPSVARADALETAGRFAIEQGDWSHAGDVLSQALMLGRALGDTRRIAQFLRARGWLAMTLCDYGNATVLLEESVAVYRSIGDKHGIARVLSLQGQVAFTQLAFAQAVSLLRESIALARELCDDLDAAWSINLLGLTALHQGDFSEADRLLQESLDMFTRLEHQRGIAWARGNLGWVHLGQGMHRQAAELFEDSLRRHSELGEKRNIVFSLERLAALASAQGQVVRGARLFGAASALRQSLAVPILPVIEARYAPYLATLHAALGTDGVAAARAEGAALSTEQAITYALQRAPVLADSPATSLPRAHSPMAAT